MSNTQNGSGREFKLGQTGGRKAEPSKGHGIGSMEYGVRGPDPRNTVQSFPSLEQAKEGVLPGDVVVCRECDTTGPSQWRPVAPEPSAITQMNLYLEDGTPAPGVGYMVIYDNGRTGLTETSGEIHADFEAAAKEMAIARACHASVGQADTFGYAALTRVEGPKPPPLLWGILWTENGEVERFASRAVAEKVGGSLLWDTEECELMVSANDGKNWRTVSQ